MADEEKDPLGLRKANGSTGAVAVENPQDDPLGLRAQVKKKDSTIVSDNTSGLLDTGSNPFLDSRIRRTNPLMDPRIPVNSPETFPYNDSGVDYYANSKAAVKKEVAARKANASSVPVEDAPAVDDQSYGSEVAESLFERGLARLYGMVAKTPSFLYRLASVPQNAIADATGWESLRPMTPEQISEATGVKNYVADYYDKIAEESQQKMNQKYDNTITGYLDEGNWGKAAALAGNQIAESIPVTLGIALTRGAGASSGATVLGGGAVFGAGKYAQIQDSDLPENVKVFNSALTGLTEGVFENLGTGKIVDAGIDILKNQGKEAGFEFAKSSFSTMYKSALKKFYIVNSTIAEGVEEAATQFAQNLIDRETGVNPNVKLTDGLLDSFIVGAGSGLAMSAPIEAYSKITNPAKKLEVQSDIQANQTLAEDINNPEVPENLKGNLLRQFMANNERINNEIEQNDYRLNRLSPEESSLAESVLVQINQIDEIINNDAISAEAKVIAVQNQDSLYQTLNQIISGEPSPLDRETQIERQNRIDKEVAQFQTNFPERTIDPLDDLPNSVVTTFDRVDNDVPTDIVAINEASDYLYNKYKQFTAMKEADSRTLTLEQIASVQDQLSQDISTLENYKSKYYGDEQGPSNEGTSRIGESSNGQETQAAVPEQQAEPILQPETAPDQSTAIEPNSPGAGSNSEIKSVGTITFSNPELQQSDIQIDEMSDGTFTANFEDGSSQNYTREGVKNIIGFDPDINSDNEFDARLNASTNPEEVAAIYDEEVTNLQDTGSKESAIAAYGPTATREEFSRYNDGNNMTDQIRLQYTPIGERAAGIPLDTQAQEINDTYFNGNPVVSPEDIAGFMQSFPNGSESFTSPSGNETLNRINSKYKELTGKNLRKDTARRLAEKYKTSQTVVDAAIDAVEATEENIAAIIDQDLEFADGFTTADQVKDSWLKNLNQYSEDPSNEFNLWYPVFKGAEITEEQFNNIQNLINERAIEQTGSSGRNEGPDSGSTDTESDTTEPGDTEPARERTIADKIRSLKSKPGQLYGGLQGVTTAVWDGALETLATAIEAGQSVLNAIERAVEYIKANSSVTDTELIETALRDDLHLLGVDVDTPVQPTRDPGESVSDFALRLAQWRQYNMPNLNANAQLNQNQPQANIFNNNWVLPEERAKEKLVRKNVDFLNRLEKAENAIKAQGAIIRPEDSAYMQYQLLSAKTAKQISDTMSEIVISDNKSQKSIFQRVKEAGYTISEFGLFTYAQHAPERNAYVAELRQNTQDAELARLAKRRAEEVAAGRSTKYIDNRVSLITRGKLADYALMPDGGSGMTNKDAADILAQFENDGKTADLKKFAEEYRDKVTRESLVVQYKNGLISDAEYNNITSRYKDYVPLQVEEYVKKGWASNVKNIMKTRKAINRTKGSDRTFNERVNPVLYGVVQYEKATIEASKNEWLTTLKNIVINHPNDDVWMIQKPTYIAEYNKDGTVRSLVEKTPKEIVDQSVKAFDNGKPYYIQIKDETLRRAVRQDGFIKDPTVLKVLGALNSVNSVLRNVNTLYNPNFIIENFVRDTQEASFQLSGKEKGIKRKFIKNIPAAIKGIVQHRKGDRTSPWAKEYEEYLSSGAEITFADQYTDIERLNEIGKQLDKMSETKVTPVKAFRAVKGWMDYASSLLELTTRLSAYKAAKDSGIDPTEAAVLSRNVTVDFNKKGELTNMTNALYLFANAGTQGGFNMLKKVLTSKSGRKFMGAYALAGFTTALINTMLGAGDDDKDENAVKNNYWALPQYQRASSLIIKNPLGDGFFKIPVGRALASPFFFGSEILGVMMGKVKTSDAIKDVSLNVLTSHNPLGGSEEVLQVISPTVADPLVQVYTNKNNFGSPIVKEQKYGAKKPASQSYFKNTNELSIMTTNWLNDISGGSSAESGAIDISPNRIDWTAQTVGGGLANFIKNNILRFTTEITDGDMDGVIKDAPILGRFYTTSKPVSALSSVFETLEKSGTEKMSDVDKKQFIETLKEARKSKEIDAADAKRYNRTFLKNQKRIELARKHPDWDQEKLDRYFKRD